MTRPSLAALLCLALLLAGCSGVAQPQGWAAPAVREDTVYTSDEAGKVGAYRLAAAGRLWQFPQKVDDLKLSGIYGPVLLDRDTVYIGGYDGTIAAVNAADGSGRWAYEVGERMIGGLLVAGDSLYAGTNGGFLVALDRENGAERWRREIGKEIWATPVRAGEAIVIASMDGRLTAFSADGTERWQEKVAEAGIAGTPAVQGETLYAGSFDKRLYAVDARNGETLWRSPEAGNWFWTEPLVDGDNLYAGNLDGKVYAYDRRTGEERWQSDVDGPVRGRTALDGGVLLVPVKNGRLWGLRPESGTRAWEPVTIGGRLYTDLVPATGGVLLATETGRKSHRLYRIDAGQGSVNEIALTP